MVSTRRDIWAVSGDCIYSNQTLLWYCPWLDKYENNLWGWNEDYHNVAFIEIDVPGLTDGEDSPFYDDDNDQTGYVGYFSQFGRNYSTPYGVFPNFACPSNTGIYARFVYGAPSYWYIGNEIQIPRKNYILLAMKYPTNTQFNVYITFGGDYDDPKIAFNVTQVSLFDTIAYSTEDLYDDENDWICPDYSGTDLSYYKERRLCTDTGGLGPAWYFDDNKGFFYIRVVNPVFYSIGYHSTWREDELVNLDGMQIFDHGTLYYYQIEASCSESSCNSVIENGHTFFEVDDEIPDKLDTQDWTSTGYFADFTTRTDSDDTDNGDSDGIDGNSGSGGDTGSETDDGDSGNGRESSDNNDDMLDLMNWKILAVIGCVLVILLIVIIVTIVCCKNKRKKKQKDKNGLLGNDGKELNIQRVQS